jgi:hypothetical protein
VVREMARAARAGARIALIDMVNGGARHDELEILRDPSHTRAFTRSEAIAMLAAAGAEPVKVDLRRQALPVQRWLTQAAPPPDAHEAVFAALTAEADGGEPTGLNAHRDADGVLHIAQDWLLLVARVGG